MGDIVKDHPTGDHPFAVSLLSSDCMTLRNTDHRVLLEGKQRTTFLEYMKSSVQTHHISPELLQRHQELIKSFAIKDLPPLTQSIYPRSTTTQRGNFAEIFLAEYLCATTESQLPVYRLRYNPNPDQSMKGDDVLLFDLDSDPVRIIVGESKFRSTPSKEAVIETVEGLARSNKAGLPTSLIFVANRLFNENKPNLGQKVLDCALFFVSNKLQIDYVGLLMSNKNARNTVNAHTPNELKRLLMISLGLNEPASIVTEVFDRLEGEL